jgi:hypothetical protein
VFQEPGAVADVRSAACAYFGVPCDEGGDEPDEPADPDAPPPAKGKAKAWRPGPR